MKDKKWWLVMNTTKDSLKSAPGFKYDSNTITWYLTVLKDHSAVTPTNFHRLHQ